MRAPWLLVTLMLMVPMSGCMGDVVNLGPDPTSPEQDFRPYTVVAPIDTGINVYHDHFRSNETLPDWMLEAFGVTMVCNLTFEGTWQERYEADREDCWDVITSSDIVYFPGTRILGATPDDGTEIPILDDPADGHGTAVTGAVLDANPDAIIFFVEGFSDATVLAAANQPLVDIVTTSFGPIGSIPVPGIEDATRVAVVDEGKIHTGASDNSPSPAVQDGTAGPPWSIGISGYAEEEDDQKEIMSGSYPDIARTGPNSYRIMMTSMDITRRAGPPSQHLARQASSPMSSHIFEPNQGTSSPVHPTIVLGWSTVPSISRITTSGMR